MQVRHRIPTIFNLSMVDVLCCALGCIIFLWLANLRTARDRAAAAEDTTRLLASTRSDLEDATQKATATSAQLATVEQQMRDAEAQLQKLRVEREQVRRDLEAARARLAALQQQTTDDAERLTKLAKEKMGAAQRVTELELLLREKDKLANAAGRRADELTERLLDAERRAKQLAPLAEMVPGLKKDAEGYRDKLAAAEQRAQTLEKKLAAADRSLTLLEDERKQLTDQAAQARAAAENRFAGITLTGRRVVFLVDMSGSMDLVDAETASADKWIGVRETLAKIMRSLPRLEKFQVILFSDKVVFPLGGAGEWLDHDPQAAGRVLKALAAVKPRGNTNMYAGLDAAFRLRAQGLDTIYVLSDGLPNIGEGVTEQQAKNLRETERAELLGKHIRKKLKGEWNPEVTGRPRVRINAVGFFYESPDVGAFLWALARENEGSFVGMSKP